jgi:hypothetical protein
MKMIEKTSKKTCVRNVEHTKLQPNKHFTSITLVAHRAPRTQIPPLDALSTSRGTGLGLLQKLRGIFIACKTSKDVIIKRQEVILHNQHIIYHKLQIAEPLEEFGEIEAELIDPYGSITT